MNSTATSHTAGCPSRQRPVPAFSAADIYLAMTGGQVSLSLESRETAQVAAGPAHERLDRSGLALAVQRATDEEAAAHDAMLKAMTKKHEPLWLQLETALGVRS